MLALVAAVPIFIISILMIFFMWPSSKAMPLGWISAATIAWLFWDMPLRWLAAASIAGIINAIDILIIVFGALLILQLMKKSGALRGISHSMATVAEDRRVQLIIIGWLMVSFLEGAAGFGTPAAVAAPLLVGMGFPPLIAAVTTLIADSTAVSFGAVGVPVWGGFAALQELLTFPTTDGSSVTTFTGYLYMISFYSAVMHLLIGSFIPLIMVSIMTRITEGSFRKGLEIWPLALFGGLCFTIPQFLIAVLIGPELPSLLGSLIGLPVFIFAASHGFLSPKDTWDFPPRREWPSFWEGSVKPGTEHHLQESRMPALMAWTPYIIIGVLLFLTRINLFGLTDMLKSLTIGWDRILGTTISKGITPLYNPGIIPFVAVALLIPLLYKMNGKETLQAWRDTLGAIRWAAIALFFALAMVYILMNSGEATETPSMLLVMAEAAAGLAGRAWIFVAPLIGILGTFISGSNTVSNIMFGPFQLRTASQIGLPDTIILALQNTGGAAGNMICIHNVVAVLTTVGLLGKEGRVIRENIFVCLYYGLAAGVIGWAIVFFSFSS